MSNASSVTYPVGRSRLQGALTLLMPAGALVAWVSWAFWAGPTTVPISGWLLLGAILLCGAWMARQWQATPQGVLEWTPPQRPGQAGQWRWRSAAYQAGAPVQGLVVLLDFQSSLLLGWCNADGVRHWAWLESRRQASQWWPFRRALCAGGALRH